MKKIIWIGLALLMVIGVSQMATAASFSETSIKLAGDIIVLGKAQNSYVTPLDMLGNYEFEQDEDGNIAHPQSNRGGANYRGDQNFLAKGNFKLYYGDLGKSEWFGIAEVKWESNDYDEPNDLGNENRVDTGNVFIMWRPLEIMGGRPLGITLGRQIFKGTANAAYFHMFEGDFNDDFIMYTAAVLYDTPAIKVDFHIDPKTGIAIGYASGVKDASQIGAQVSGDGCDNFVAEAEFGRWGVGFNAGFQHVRGARELSNLVWADERNDFQKSYLEYGDVEGEHQIYNAQLTYTLDLGSVSIMPAIGWQGMRGEEAPYDTFDRLGYETREISGDIYTMGLKIDWEMFGKKNEFVGQYTELEATGLDGIDWMPPGYLNETIKGFGADLVNAVSGIDYDWDNDFNPLCGQGDAPSALADIDYTVHLEYNIQMNDNITMGFFFNHLEGGADDSIGDKDLVVEQLTDRLTQKFMNAGVDRASAEAGASNLVSTFDALGELDPIAESSLIFQWTDTTSYGCYVKLSF